MPYGVTKKELLKMRQVVLKAYEQVEQVCPALIKAHQEEEAAQYRFFEHMTNENEKPFVDLVMAQGNLQDCERVVLVDLAVNLVVRLMGRNEAEKIVRKVEKEHRKKAEKPPKPMRGCSKKLPG